MTSSTQRRPVDIGYVSFFPPEQNGVGDVTYSLLSVENPRFRITLYSCMDKPVRLPSNTTYQRMEELLARENHDHDLLITTASNSYEWWSDVMAGITHRHGGIVHVHDGSLNGMINGLKNSGVISEDEYFKIYENWYGSGAVAAIRAGAPFWETDLAMAYNGLGEICARAQGIITSNAFLAQSARTHFHDKPVASIEQHYYDLPRRRSRPNRGKPWRISSYGFIHQVKKIYDIFFALKELPPDFDYIFELVGSGYWNTIENCYRLVEKLGLSKRVRFRINLSQKQFLQHMADTDIGIQLRYPTMGETSSVCQRMLYGGIPMIVSDIGYYTELPPFVSKIPVIPETVLKMDGRVRLAHDPSILAKAILETTAEYDDRLAQQSVYAQDRHKPQRIYAENYFRVALKMASKSHLLEAQGA